MSKQTEYLDDTYISEKALEEIRSGKDQVLTSKEFWDAVEYQEPREKR